MNHSHLATRVFPPAMAGENATVRVVAIEGGNGLARLVTETGLHVGSEITVRSRQGGALAVARGPTRYALGGGMAHRILVHETPSTPAGEGT